MYLNSRTFVIVLKNIYKKGRIDVTECGFLETDFYKMEHIFACQKILVKIITDGCNRTN